MKKFYRFAGVEVCVDIPDEWMFGDDRQLVPFRVDRAECTYIYDFVPVDCLTAPSGKPEVLLPGVRIYREGESYVRYIGAVENGWENAYIRAQHMKTRTHVQVRILEQITCIGVKTVLNAMAAEHLIAGNRGFVFHCSYIDVGGKAILFTAPSETGKSTQADLWAKHRGAEIINGDRAAIRLVGDTLMAEGIPFAGSSQYCKNRSLPIEAIIYLGQAPVTTIRKLRGYEAFSKIWEGVSVNTWDPEDMDLVSGIAQKVAEQIPIYHMPCTPDEAAVIALEETLRKQGSL